ncbi:hypothetical protein WME90_19585 [Sorangium sp. So ce375]|uniref:hypothetical protein n=1 Tax=Sorangium sp. So ce375 TaxID=3133306 RepID=UPI003F5B4B06
MSGNEGTADWQRPIVPALLAVLSELPPAMRPQVLAARRASEASMAARRSSG